MSNYLSQIAARSLGKEGDSLGHFQTSKETNSFDPFDQVSAALDSSGFPEGDLSPRPIPIDIVQNHKEQVQDIGDLQGKGADYNLSEPVRPAYLSAFAKRHLYPIRVDAKQEGGGLLGKDVNLESTLVRTEAILGSKFQNNPLTASLPTTHDGEFNPIQKASLEFQSEVPPSILDHQASDRKKMNELIPKPEKGMEELIEDSSRQPISAQFKEHAFLQPPIPDQHPLPPKKETPVPKLVIGKISVEIIPAPQAVNKVINHVIQPQADRSSPQVRSKHSFGLGQL